MRSYRKLLIALTLGLLLLCIHFRTPLIELSLYQYLCLSDSDSSLAAGRVAALGKPGLRTLQRVALASKLPLKVRMNALDYLAISNSPGSTMQRSLGQDYRFCYGPHNLFNEVANALCSRQRRGKAPLQSNDFEVLFRSAIERSHPRYYSHLNRFSAMLDGVEINHLKQSHFMLVGDHLVLNSLTVSDLVDYITEAEWTQSFENTQASTGQFHGDGSEALYQHLRQRIAKSEVLEWLRCYFLCLDRLSRTKIRRLFWTLKNSPFLSQGELLSLYQVNFQKLRKNRRLVLEVLLDLKQLAEFSQCFSIALENPQLTQPQLRELLDLPMKKTCEKFLVLDLECHRGLNHRLRTDESLSPINRLRILALLAFDCRETKHYVRLFQELSEANLALETESELAILRQFLRVVWPNIFEIQCDQTRWGCAQMLLEAYYQQPRFVQQQEFAIEVFRVALRSLGRRPHAPPPRVFAIIDPGIQPFYSPQSDLPRAISEEIIVCLGALQNCEQPCRDRLLDLANRAVSAEIRRKAKIVLRYLQQQKKSAEKGK